MTHSPNTTAPLTPDAAFAALRALKETMPQTNFTPAEWREWERQKWALLETVWRAANANRS